LTSHFLTSSPPEFRTTAYKTRNTRASTSTSKDRGKASKLNESSPDSQEDSETPPSKHQKEEPDSQLPDQGYPALAITNHQFPDNNSQNSTSNSDDLSDTESRDSVTITTEPESEEAVMDISE
ncbi:hypothetical protein A2U01_0060516, partial [Trifolium medium]|nr:hypothetical protein [Trifolium medium]